MRRHWSKQRCARLGWLHGRGLAPAAIAADMILNTTEEVIRRRIVAMGLPTPPIQRLIVTSAFRPKAYEAIEAAAAVRGVNPSELISKMVDVMGDHPSLIDNILEE
jgi:hypothetical protein